MTTIETIESKISALLSQESAAPVELRKLLLEIDELINSVEFQELDHDSRSRLQNLRKELKTHIRVVEEIPALTISNLDPAERPGKVSTLPEPNIQTSVSTQAHNADAEGQMEDAEKLFYSGRYAEAIKLFDRVLQLEPKWERARQHRTESENYLRTGYIPPVALPAEAASAFGKAQSAARVGRYSDALALLSKAQNVLREVGIQRWQEGLEFEQKLQENIDAENVYQEGLKLFEVGRIDEAIEHIETASRATGLPKYNDKAQEFRRVRDSIRGIHETLSGLSIEPKAAAQAKADLDLMTSQYGNNPALQRLESRLEATIPRVVAPLKDQLRSLKSQAERAETMEETLHLAKQAKIGLDQIRNLEGLDDSLDRLQNDVGRLLRETEKYEQDLTQANHLYENNKRWPTQAFRLSEGVRQRYPNDPNVIQLNRLLSRFNAARVALRVSFILLGLGIIALLTWLAAGKFQDYRLSLTPTITGTATQTPTFTTTPTTTPTSTPTPTHTPTPTPTPTPVFGMALRDIWARNGCYEGYTATGRIPSGSKVYFLIGERRFDTFNRECVLVEFRENGRSIIGWVLLLDIGAGQALSPTP
jgi:tetratricopeptide (TPR) repeat protein